MTDVRRQVKPERRKNKKLRPVKCILEEDDEEMDRCTKPLITSCDENKIAGTTSRAELLRRIDANPDKHTPWEFTSYFEGPTNSFDPPYSVTSHTKRVPILKQRSVIPTYPSLISSIRWNPYISAASSIESFRRDTEEDRTFNCRCENCSQRRCPSKMSVSSTPKPTFKDNIMAFIDQCTMTPRLKEASCGVTPVSSPFERDECVSVTEIAVRDNEMKDNYQKTCPWRSPILKRQCCSAPKNGGRQNPESILVDDDVLTHTDADDAYSKPVRSRSIKTFLRRSNDKSICRKCSRTRNILYNEGIDDNVMEKISIKPAVVPPPMNLHNGISRISIKNRYHNDIQKPIPYSHRYDSKYHMNCKERHGPRIDRDMDEMKHLVASSKVERVPCGSKPVNHYKPLIKLPRRVLTSDNDIEGYIANSRLKGVIGGAGERNGRKCYE